MSWNYRAIKTPYEPPYEGHAFYLHEVYYDSDGKPSSWTQDPMRPNGESLEDLKDVLGMMLKGADAPPLEIIDGELKEVE